MLNFPLIEPIDPADEPEEWGYDSVLQERIESPALEGHPIEPGLKRVWNQALEVSARPRQLFAHGLFQVMVVVEQAR